VKPGPQEYEPYKAIVWGKIFMSVIRHFIPSIRERKDLFNHIFLSDIKHPNNLNFMNNNSTKYFVDKAVKQAIYRGAAFSVILLLTALGVGAQTWQVVGNVDFSGNGDAWNTCILIDTGGVPYISYEDATRADKTTVMKFNGTSWVPVDTAGVTPGGAGAPALAMDKYGTPYVVYSDGTNNDGATVMKHVGSSWDIVGAPGFNGNLINFPSIAIDTSGTIYVAYIDGQNSNAVTVMKNSGGGWVGVGAPGFGSEYSAYSSIALDTGGTPYVVYGDGYHGPATVQKFNGTSWVPVGSTGFTPTGTYSTFIKIDKYGTPYVTYAFGNGSYIYGDSAGVMKFDGTNWVSLNPTKFSVTAGNPNINIAIDTFGAPYVVYQDFHHAGAATVAAFNGTSWVPEGNVGFSAAGVQYPDITVTKSGTIYVAYMDQANNYGATVMELAGVSAVLGVSNMCAGSTYTFSDASAGGTWSSSNTTVATVGSSTGVVTAVAAGTTTISYTLGGTTVTSLLNVNPAASIGGPGAIPVCVGAVVTLNGTPAGGTWTSNIPSSATVSSTGVVTVTATGDGTIQYVSSSGCTASVILEINPMPAITTFTTICTNYTAALVVTAGAGGGTWSSSNTAAVAVYNGGVPYEAGVAPGTSTISYTTPGAGCVATLVVTENADPVISGTPIVCGTSSTTLGLSAGVTGGTWSSSNSYITVGSSSGTITGAANGTSTITYTTPDLSCFAYQVVTDNPVPVINGFSVICTNTTVELELIEGVTGGTWSSSNTAAFVTFSSAIPPYVWGVGPGTATISYVTPGAGCTASMVVTDNADPVISGTSSLCGYTEATLGLSAGATGGTWSSSNTSSVTVGLNSGILMGGAPGTSTITYTAPTGFGCSAYQVITDNPQPGGISGASEICAGSTTSYYDYPGGGLWSSGSTSVATVGTDGTVYGVSAGTASIIYTLAGGCDTSRVITIEPSPSAITGPTSVCTGSTIFLTDATPGGSWSTGSSSITLSDTGSVYGTYITGTATVTYTMPSGCYVTTIVTVNRQPSLISGISEICAGSTTSYSDFPSGGMWTSGSTSVATVGTSGTVYGVSAGTANITYTMPGGCYASAVITIQTTPSIGGTNIICGTSTTTLTASPTGGTWSSNNTSVAYVSGSGVVTGVSVGTANISYAIGDGCSSYVSMADNPVPVINGFTTICTGTTVSLGLITGVSGGTWSSSNTASFVILGTATYPYAWGVGPGTSTISYITPGAGCTASIVVTDNAVPVISGTFNLCGYSSTTLGLSAGATGGTWSSSNTSSVTVGLNSGTIMGVYPGTSTITYTTGFGCTATQIVADNEQPGAVSGSSEICAGSTTSYSDYPSGGMWSSGSTSVATVGTDGTVYGVSAGTASIIYTAPGGCDTSSVITIEPAPLPISGPSAVCVGATITLTDATPGGSWSTGSATILLEGSGSVLGYVAGTATVTYTVPSGCYVTTVITVDQLPGVPSGSSEICAGATTSYSDYPSGGMWSSGSTSVATVGTDGTVYGVSAGTANISYTMPGGCYATSVISINASPSPIGGPSTVCVGSTIVLTDATPGGSWSTSSPDIFLTDTGSVLGYVPGTAIVMYTMPSGCFVNGFVVVNQAPGAISGSSAICVGAMTSYSDSPEGGVWSSGTTSIATVGTNGNVYGVSAGTANITYTTAAGCSTSSVITINPLPSAIGGPSTVCVGSTIVLTDATPGGSWSTSSATIMLTGTGSVLGYVPGTATVTYTAPSGCFVTKLITVSTGSAGTIAGVSSVNTGAHITLTDATGGGVWSASNSNATVSGGVVTGVAAGTVIISYAVTGSCGIVYATKVITVNNSTIPGINGNTSICAGGTTSLSDIATGGTWSMSSVVATINGSTGIVTASNTYAGTATVTYTQGGASATIVVTVNANPTPIQGVTAECAGMTISLTDATAGGVWSGTGDATVTGTGTSGTLVAGGTGGTATVVYTTASGCFVTITNTIYSNPLPIAGVFNVCVGAVTILSDASPGASWTSSNTAIASAAGADITGIAAGTAIITFKSSAAGSCITTQIINVSAQPAAISGNTNAICAGTTLTLTDGSGIWTSSNTTIATVGSGSGIVTGMSGGTATITYAATGAAGCVAKTTVTVSAVPTVTGTAAMCIGGTTALHDAVAGGTWSSGSGNATVSAAGVVTGVASGTAIITYTTAGGCMGMLTVTVSGTSSAINGNLFLCQGTSTTLTDASAGGTWSIGSGIASVVGSTGVVTASATLTGTATISYTTSGCSATAILTVNAKPMPIQGATSECTGITVSLSDVTAGGTWSGTGDATVTGTGASGMLVAGAVSGTAIVTYTIGSGCMTTITNTIYSVQPITGNFNMCVGLVTDLSDASSPGSWSSSSTAIAIASGPDISGEGVGTVTISFRSSAAGTCIATQVVTVSSMPIVTPINGPATISSVGSPVSISDATAGGVWTSSNTSVITLSGSTGSPVGATALTTTGSSVITYAVTIAGCTTKVTKTFAASTASHPGGVTTIEAGSAVSLADDIPNGIWSSSDNGIATVDASGLVTGIMPGNVNITHEVTGDDGTESRNVTNVTVSAVPAIINVLPNPNKGTFTVRGTVGSVADEAVTLEVTDLLGQVIYRNNVTAFGGRLNETIALSNGLANGMYILNVKSGTENKTFHFVIEE